MPPETNMPPETPDEAHNEDVTQNTILTMTEGAAEVDRQIRDAMEIAEEEMKSAVFQNPSSAFQPQIEILKQSNWACQEGPLFIVFLLNTLVMTCQAMVGLGPAEVTDPIVTMARQLQECCDANKAFLHDVSQWPDIDAKLKTLIQLGNERGQNPTAAQIEAYQNIASVTRSILGKNPHANEHAAPLLSRLIPEKTKSTPRSQPMA